MKNKQKILHNLLKSYEKKLVERYKAKKILIILFIVDYLKEEEKNIIISLSFKLRLLNLLHIGPKNDLTKKNLSVQNKYRRVCNICLFVLCY